MKRFSGVMLVLIVSLMVSLAGVRAQNDPLLIVMDGALYSWSGNGAEAVKPYATCSPSERIVSDIARSSDGRIAFLTEPQPVTDVILQFGSVGGGPLPTNVRVCDGGNLTALATQPENFSYFEGDTADVAVARGAPTWSPDGQALAWTSFNYSSGTVSLNVFNANGDGQTVSNRIQLPDFTGEVVPPYITWHEDGIYMFHTTLDNETFEFADFVFLFDGLGNLMFQTQLPPTDETRFVYDKFIVEDAGQEWIGLLYNDGGWDLIHPETGEVQPANGVGELYSKSGTTDISLLLTLDESQQYVWTARNSDGIVRDVNGNNVTVPGVFPTSTDLSGNGVWVFQLFDGLYFWSMTASGHITGSEQVTSGFSALAWSDTAWRIHHDT